MEAGRKRLAGYIVRQANTGEVTTLRRETRELREVVAELLIRHRQVVIAGANHLITSDSYQLLYI